MINPHIINDPEARRLLGNIAVSLRDMGDSLQKLLSETELSRQIAEKQLEAEEQRIAEWESEQRA